MNPLLVGPVFELGQKLIDKMFPDREKQASERAQAELALLQAQQDGTLKAQAQQLSAILAEAQSADPWTSRARPTFLYVIYVMILASIPMGFLSAHDPETAKAVAEGMKMWLAAIPGELYSLFGVGYLGYTWQRGQEKKAGLAR